MPIYSLVALPGGKPAHAQAVDIDHIELHPHRNAYTTSTGERRNPGIAPSFYGVPLTQVHIWAITTCLYSCTTNQQTSQPKPGQPILTATAPLADRPLTSRYRANRTQTRQSLGFLCVPSLPPSASSRPHLLPGVLPSDFTAVPSFMLLKPWA